MRRFLWLIALILPLSKNDSGQEINSKSKAALFLAVQNAKDDSTRMMNLLGLGYSVYAGSNLDSAIYYYNQAYAIAVRLKNKVGLLRYYACYGDVLSAKAKHYEAIIMAKQAVALAEGSGNDRYKGAAYNNMAGAYTDVADIGLAYSYYLKAIAAYERLNDKKHLAAVYANITGIFFSIGHSPEKALKYGLKAIEVSRCIGDYPVTEEAMVNIANVYLALGRTKDALDILTQAKAISERINDKSYVLSELVAFNNIFVLQGKYGRLKQNTAEIFRISEETGDKRALANAEYFSALADFDLKNYTPAKIHLERSISLSRDYRNTVIEEKAYNLLGSIDLLDGDVAAYHRNGYLEDSIRAKRHADQILRNSQELETKYNLAKKEAEISALNEAKQVQSLKLQRRDTYVVVLIFMVALLLFSGTLIYKSRVRKEKLLLSEKELKEQQIQILKTEKELLSTQALMKGQEEERSRLAKDLHDGLGGILTGTKYALSNMKQNMIITAENAAAFEKTMNMLDQSISELRRVAHNMMPESLLKLSLDDAIADYCHQVANSIKLKIIYQSFDIENMEADEAVNIAVYRIVQELVNNVVKHAGAKTVIVQITMKENILGITVEDDGEGFDIANLPVGGGMGYKNLKSRVDFLKGNIDVKSGPGKGTSVLIKLPV